MGNIFSGGENYYLLQGKHSIMSDDSNPGIEGWVAETSAFDRLRSVAFALQRPQSAGEIADQAHVSEKTARGHLQRLVEMDAMDAWTDGGRTTYYPDPGYVRYREVRSLAREYDRDELVEQVAAIKREIEGWQREYDVDSPTELRASVAGIDVSEAAVYERQQVTEDWELAEHRLDLFGEALNAYDRLTSRPPASA